MLSKEERIKLIKQIEEKTNSKVLVYFTGDRQGLETRISHDVIPIISKHISKFNSDRISLFIYTPGGITVAGYGIVNLIREHCKELRNYSDLWSCGGFILTDKSRPVIP